MDDAIEIPRAVKSHLGLDTNRSWVVITEANIFAWPGPDLRPAINGDPSTIVYGHLPPTFFEHIRRKFVALARRGKTNRSNEPSSRHSSAMASRTAMAARASVERVNTAKRIVTMLTVFWISEWTTRSAT